MYVLFVGQSMKWKLHCELDARGNKNKVSWILPIDLADSPAKMEQHFYPVWTYHKGGFTHSIFRKSNAFYSIFLGFSLFVFAKKCCGQMFAESKYTADHAFLFVSVLFTFSYHFRVIGFVSNAACSSYGILFGIFP